MLDTNVLLSAAFHPDRTCAIIVDLMIRGEVQNYASEAVLKEVRGIMCEHRRFSLLRQYEEHTKIVYPRERITACSDSDDNKFLECAVAAEAQFIISGDNALLEMDSYQGIRILTAKEFLQIPF